MVEKLIRPANASAFEEYVQKFQTRLHSGGLKTNF